MVELRERKISISLALESTGFVSAVHSTMSFLERKPNENCLFEVKEGFVAL